MIVLFDTNVVLDYLFDRMPFSEAAEKLYALVQKKRLRGFLCATTITTIFYIAAKVIGAKNALEKIAILLNLFEIAPVDHDVLRAAATLGFKDFEDAVLHEAAAAAHAEYIVTRNPGDFKKAGIPVYTPTEMLLILRVKQN